MPRNNNKNKTGEKEERKLIEKDENHDYGIVTNKLGSGRFMVRVNSVNEKGKNEEKKMMARLCGKFRKGSMKKMNIVDIGTVVLLGLRDYQDDMVDIVYVYQPQEVRQLRKSGTLVLQEMDEDNKAGNEPEQTAFDFDDI